MEIYDSNKNNPENGQYINPYIKDDNEAQYDERKNGGNRIVEEVRENGNGEDFGGN